MSDRLFVFTGAFPYEFKENFLEQEVIYLKSHFNEVTFIPFSGAGTKQRPLPIGVKVDNRLHCSRRKKILLGLLNCWRVFPLYYVDFFHSNVFLEKKKLIVWAKTTVLTSFYLQSKPIKELRKSISSTDVLYYYWGVEYNGIAPFFKGKCKQVSRFHGDWDLWRDGGKKEVYSPCREYLMQSLNCAVAISDKGKTFLKTRYPSLNVETFRLGSNDSGIVKKSTDGVLRVVSCSSVYPLKRVDFIFECMQALSEQRNVIWTHIGDGPSYSELLEKCKDKSTDRLQICLIGRKMHDEVMLYYINNPVDLFINLSTNEGVPVSVMEAISFNVPVVATNVGATDEVVTKETGILVSPNPSIKEVVKAIEKVICASFEPRVFWNEYYNAEKNYNRFSAYIKSFTI